VKNPGRERFFPSREKSISTAVKIKNSFQGSKANARLKKVAAELNSEFNSELGIASRRERED